MSNPHDEREISEVKSLLRRLEVVAQGDEKTQPNIMSRRLSTERVVSEPDDYLASSPEIGEPISTNKEAGQSFGGVSLLVANVVMATATITSLAWYLVYSSTIERRLAASGATAQLSASVTAGPQRPAVGNAAPRELATSPAPIALAAPVIAPVPPPSAPVLDEAARRRLVARGEELVGLGQINSARLAFERAAMSGSAEAAMGLGDTYDPRRLLQWGAPLNLADIAKATYWYERADEMGAPDAKNRILALTQR